MKAGIKAVEIYQLSLVQEYERIASCSHGKNTSKEDKLALDRIKIQLKECEEALKLLKNF